MRMDIMSRSGGRSARPWPALVLVAATLAGLVATPAPTAAAAAASPREPVVAQDGDSTLTWSVRPTPTDEAPERPNFAYDLDPGQRVEDSVRIRNFGDEPLSLTIYASDALTTASGALDLLPAGGQPTDVGAWVVLDTAAVEVPPQELVDVPFTVVVPADAESGDHSGGIVTSYRSPGTNADGQQVVVDRRLGSRMHVRVGGELRPQLAVADIAVSYSPTGNPLGTGDLHVTYTVTNTGNVRLGAEQVVLVPGRLGFPGREAVLEQMPELLPSHSLSYSVDVPDVWPTFRTLAGIELRPVATREGDVFDADTPLATGSAATWSVPWSLLTVLLVVAAGVLWVVWRRHRRQRREQAVNQQAAQTAAIVRETVQAMLAARGTGAVPEGAGAEGAGTGVTGSGDREHGGTPERGRL